MMERSTARAAVLRCLIVFVAAAACGAAPLSSRAAAPAAAELFAFTPKSADDLRLIEQRVQDVVQRVMPATVGIVAPSGQGSGVIISEDGYILTAGHVIREANLPLTIILADGRKVQGRSLGINRTMDSGLAKITDPGEWPHATMGKSSPLSRGQWVVALGHPGGYRSERPPVVRLGRLSVCTRMLLVSNCTLVGGDSGGPLFDFDGKVVGIHSRIGTSTASNMHVPVDTFLSTWDRLAKGDVWGVKLTGSRAGPRGAMLGVYTLDHDQGVRVDSVKAGTPAEAAGIKPGDILTAIDGEPLASRQRLNEELDQRGPSQQARLDMIRDGKFMTVTVKLATRGS